MRTRQVAPWRCPKELARPRLSLNRYYTFKNPASTFQSDYFLIGRVSGCQKLSLSKQGAFVIFNILNHPDDLELFLLWSWTETTIITSCFIHPGQWLCIHELEVHVKGSKHLYRRNHKQQHLLVLSPSVWPKDTEENVWKCVGSENCFLCFYKYSSFWFSFLNIFVLPLMKVLVLFR